MRWQWSVWGKHPAFNDFFQLGPTSPLVTGMVEWMRNGYAQIKIDRRNFISWRFWMRGLAKEGLACGLLRDSSDRLGRPHPILVMGTGSLINWEKNWDLLPFAFEASWNQMESLTTKSFKAWPNLEEEMTRIPSPSGEWEKMAQRRGGEKTDHNLIEEQVRKNLNRDLFFIAFEQTFSFDPIVLVSLYHYYWKKEGESAPNSIFLGGGLAKTFLAFYRRPLMTKDFQDLWSDSLGSK